MISILNKNLNTTEITLCNKPWNNINFEKVPNYTLFKQRKAFLNIINNNSTRRTTEDRISCSHNFKNYINNLSTIHDKRYSKLTSLGELVKAAYNSNNIDEQQVINKLWKQIDKSINILNNVIPIVDVSASMEQDNENPINNAIGLGIKLAENSKYGKKMMTFSTTPQWINLKMKPIYVK